MDRAAEWAKNASANCSLMETGRLTEGILTRALTGQRSTRCGHALMATCRACQKMVSPEWKFCPHCRQDFLVSGRSFA